MAQQVDHYIPFFGRDFYASTAMWTAAEVGHYIRLLVIQWDSGALPADLDRLELVSPGVGSVWKLLQTKFPVCQDGLRRNARMEEHRAKAQELKEKRANSGRKGGKQKANPKQTPKQNGSKTEANDLANDLAKTKPPSPSPSPSLPPSAKEKHHHHQAEASCSAFPQAEDGWAGDGLSQWETLRAAWNATPGVERFEGLNFPRTDLLVARVSDPNWLRMYPDALQRLPTCKWFDRPVSLRQFLSETFVADVLCGTFDPEKPNRARTANKRSGGNL